MRNRKFWKRSKIKVAPAQDVNRDFPKYFDIRESLLPIIIFLKIFGLYHETADNCGQVVEPQGQDDTNQNNVSPSDADSNVSDGINNVSNNVQTTETKTSLSVRTFHPSVRWLTKAYSVLILIVLLVNTVKYFWALQYADSISVSFRVVMTNWNCQNFFNSLCLFVSCWKTRYFKTFYNQWIEFFKDPITRDLGMKPANCRKAIIIMLSIGTVFFLVNYIAVATVTLYEYSPAKEFLQHNLLDPLPVNTWTLVLAMLIHVVNTASWTVPSVFVICTSHILTVHFKQVSNILKHHINVSGGNIPLKIKDIRTRHLKLCECLGTYNLFMKWFLAVTYVSTIIGCCFLLYELIFRDLVLMSYCLDVFWLMINVLSAAGISLSLTRLHEAAHGPLDVLFCLETDNVELSQALQVQLFLSKLTGTTIGASVLDLFIVTKESLLTIAGAYLTYFLLVIQYTL